MNLAKLGALGVLLLGLLVRLEGPRADARTQDEVVYTYFASRVAREGTAAFPSLVDAYNRVPEFGRGPVPTRVGHILLLSAFLGKQGPQDVRTGVLLSAAAGMATLAGVLWLGWRRLGPGPALLGGLLLAVSPLESLMGRRAWIDPVFEAAALAWAAAFLHACSPGWTRGRALLLLLASVALLLVKEGGIVLLAAGAAWMAWRGTPRRILALAPAVPAALALVCLLAGGWAPVRDALAHSASLAASDVQVPGITRRFEALFEGIPMIEDPEGNLETPWYGIPAALWALSPAAAVLGLAGAWGLLRRRGTEDGFLGLLALGWLALACLHPKTLRWIAPVQPALHLAAGWMAAALLRRLGDAWAGLLLLALLGAALADAANGRRLRDAGVADPTVAGLTRHSLYPVPTVGPKAPLGSATMTPP